MARPYFWVVAFRRAEDINLLPFLIIVNYQGDTGVKLYDM